MQVIHSMNTVVTHRTFGVGRAWYWAMTAIWPFHLAQARPVFAQEYLERSAALVETGWMPDAGMPKLRGEVLVHGHCWPGTERPVRHGAVQLELGSISKRLVVQGDRYWRPICGVSRPEPFQSIPLTHEYAFGGVGHRWNPVGRGLDRQALANGRKRRLLPNIEYPEQLVGSRWERPLPAALDRIPPDWWPRARHLGRIDPNAGEGLLTLPEHTDWDWFSESAADQRTDGWFRGDEAWCLRGMHPDRSELAGDLPAVRARAFLVQRDTACVAEGAQEVPMHLDTVWFFPDQEIGVVIHRGMLQVKDECAAELSDVIVGHEALSELERDPTHYWNEYQRRADSGMDGTIAMLDMHPLLPDGARDALADLHAQDRDTTLVESHRARPSGGVFARMDAETDHARAEARQAIETAAQGLDAVLPEHEPEQTPDPLQAELDGLLADMQAAADDPALLARLPGGFTQTMDRIHELTDLLRAGAAEQARVGLEAAVTEIQQSLAAADADDPAQMERVQGLSALMGDTAEAPPLPRPEADTVLAELDELARQVAAQCQALESAQATHEISPDECEAMTAQLQQTTTILEQARASASEGLAEMLQQYRLTAHLVEAGASPHPGEEKRLRDAVLVRVNAGESCGRMDLAYCDFSGCNLRNADFSGCLLEYADFSDADLSGAHFDEAVLVGANFTRTHMDDVSLTGANLGRARLESLHLRRCSVANIVLYAASIANTTIEDSDFGQADSLTLMKAEIRDSTFTSCVLAGQSFLQVSLDQAAWVDCDLTESNWIELESARPLVFRNSRLDGANFVACTLRGLDLTGASVKNTRFLGACDLTGGCLDQVCGGATMFRSVCLDDIQATGAVLPDSDFTMASMRDVSLVSSDLSRCRFDHAQLTQATVCGCDLREASLYRANLSRADLKESSLYCANFLNATVTKDTDLRKSILTGTLLHDWRPTR